MYRKTLTGATLALALLAVPTAAMADNPNPDCTANPHLCAGGTPGPAGPPGAAGEDGQDGQDGQDGIDGQAGTNGTNGTNGADGTNGTNGIDGLNGAAGTAGTAGAADAAGTAGTTTVITREVQAPKRYEGNTLRVLTVPKHKGKRVSLKASLRSKALPTQGNRVMVDLRGQAVGNYNVRIVAKYRLGGKVHTHVTVRSLSVALA
jgi:hypothetical protein